MKLLLDENLSRRLVPFLQADFPDSTQVALIGLERASEHEFIIVTKDADFYDLSMVLGAPPCVLWLQAGNARRHQSWLYCSTMQKASRLRLMVVVHAWN